jgi:hypothetical protein
VADNITLNAGSGGAVLATEDVGPGVHYQIIKVAFGGDGVATIVTTAAGLPVNVVAPTTLPVSLAAGAGGVAKAEDAASADLDVGIPSMAVRKATPANTSGTDGDYEMLQMSAGRLWVDGSGVTLTVGSHAVTNAGTFVVQENGPGLTALQLIDDIVHSGDAAVSKYAVMGAVFDDVSPATVTENQAQSLRMTSGRALHTSLQTALPAGTNNIGDVDVLTLPALVAGTANIGDVDVLTLPGIAGDVAHDTADSGNPVKMGAQARTTLPTAVADSDRVNVMADKVGRQVIFPFAPRDRLGDGGRVTLTSTTETSLVAAGGAGVFRDIIGFVVSNESATPVRVDIADGASIGSTTDRVSLTLAASGGGGSIMLPAPLKMTTANHLWSAQLSAAVTSVYVTALYAESN